VEPGSLLTALRGLDPASRALLDLSLRRGVDDDSIAELLGTDAGSVANDRDRVLLGLAATSGGDPPKDPSSIRDAITSLPAERWAESSPEATRSSPASAPVDPPDGPSPSELTNPPRSSEPDLWAPPRSKEGSRGAVLPKSPGGKGPSARPRSTPAKRRPAAGPLAVGAVLLIALAVLGGLLLSSGGDDDRAGTDAGSQPASEGTDGERPDSNGTAPGDRGEPKPRDRAAGGEGANQDRGRDGGQPGTPAAAGVQLEPLLGGRAGRGTASLKGEGEEAALTLNVGGLPAPEGEYEVWLYNSLSDAVSLGRFAGRRIELFQPVPVDPADYRFLDISLEPADGNENHSGQSVLRAPLEELRKQP